MRGLRTHGRRMGVKEDGNGKGKQQSLFVTVGICLLYATASIVISFSYKAVMSYWGFNASFIMLALQALIGLAFTSFAYVFLRSVPGLHVPWFSWKVYKQSFVVGALFVANIAVGWVGLRLVNIPMFLCIRRTTTLFTLIVQFMLMREVPGAAVVLAVAIIVGGTLTAGYEDMGNQYIGYVFTLGNNVLTAAYLVLSRRFSDATETKGFGLVYYTSITALPISLALAVFRGEFATIMEFEHVGNPAFIASLLAASSLGVGMTYVVFLSATVNSPLLTSVTGNMKDIVSTVLGAYIFGDFTPSVLKVVGIAVSFVGGAIFAGAKLQERAAGQARAREAELAKAKVGMPGVRPSGVGDVGRRSSGATVPRLADTGGGGGGGSVGGGRSSRSREGGGDEEAGSSASSGDPGAGEGAMEGVAGSEGGGMEDGIVDLTGDGMSPRRTASSSAAGIGSVDGGVGRGTTVGAGRISQRQGR